MVIASEKSWLPICRSDSRSAMFRAMQKGAAAATPLLVAHWVWPNGARQLAFRRFDFCFRCLVLHRLFDGPLRLQRFGLVQVARPDRGVGKDRHDVGLDLEKTALHVDYLFLCLSGHFDTNHAGLDLR